VPCNPATTSAERCNSCKKKGKRTARRKFPTWRSHRGDVACDQRGLPKRVHREKPACTCVVLRATRATVAPAPTRTSADSIPRFQANATSRPSFLPCFLPGFEEGERAAKRRMSAAYLRGVICTDEAIPRRNVNYISGEGNYVSQ